jgi:hypothetical protein
MNNVRIVDLLICFGCLQRPDDAQSADLARNFLLCRLAKIVNDLGSV